MLPITIPSNRGLVNVFSGAKAKPEQSHDLLTFRQVGTEDFLNFVQHRILHQPSSADAPTRQRRLLTMASPKVGKRKISQKEREQKQVTKCLRRQLAWYKKTGGTIAQEQYSPYPRTLADCSGAPHKGNKSIWTDKLQARYTPLVVTTQLPCEWIPEVVIIDAMFMINTSPLKHIKSITEYGALLLKVFVLPHFHNHSTEVHICFDNPKQQQFNPKECEQQRRDQACKSDLECHSHVMFTPHTTTPRPWQEYVQCRQCKRA